MANKTKKITIAEFKRRVKGWDLETIVSDTTVDTIGNRKLRILVETYINANDEYTDAECGFMMAEEELKRFLKLNKKVRLRR